MIPFFWSLVMKWQNNVTNANTFYLIFLTYMHHSFIGITLIVFIFHSFQTNLFHIRNLQSLWARQFFIWTTQTIKRPLSNSLQHLARELERNQINYWKSLLCTKTLFIYPITHFVLRKRRKSKSRKRISKQFLAQRNECSTGIKQIILQRC